MIDSNAQEYANCNCTNLDLATIRKHCQCQLDLLDMLEDMLEDVLEGMLVDVLGDMLVDLLGDKLEVSLCVVEVLCMGDRCVVEVLCVGDRCEVEVLCGGDRCGGDVWLGNVGG